MRRRPTARALALIVAFGLLLLLPEPGLAASCAVPGSTTQAWTGHVRIYSKNNKVYACSTRFGRRVLLAEHTTRLDLYSRAGSRTLAFALANFKTFSSRSLGFAIFGSRDLKTGALLRRKLVGSTDATYLDVDALVVKKNGSIAFIYTWAPFPLVSHAASFYVAKRDSTGFQVLDSTAILSPDHIDWTYLRVVGDTVRWRRYDETYGTYDMRSAPFM